MICSHCFGNNNIRKYIKQNGEPATIDYICEECKEVNNSDLTDTMYLLSKSDLSEKLQKVIRNTFEHINVYSLPGGSAESYLSLNEVCWELFEDGNKLSSLIKNNHNWKEVAEGGYYDFSDEHDSVWLGKCWLEQESFDWNMFSKKIKHSLRFFDTKDFNRINELEKLNKLFEILDDYITYDDIAYRARGIKKNKLEEIQQEPAQKLGRAPEQDAGHNRFSPSGISYIYLAYDEKTAVSEVYDVDKNLYAIGKFGLENGLRLLNLKQDNFERLSAIYVNPFDDNFESYFNCSIGALQLFIKAIQQPINNDEKSLEYLPTQVLAEYIRLQGYDGFIFDSTKNDDGVNIVLFENKMSYVDFQEIKASIKIELEDI